MNARPAEPNPGGGATVRPAGPGDRAAIDAVLSLHWGSSRVATRGRLYDALDCPGLVAVAGGERIGFLTYCREGDEFEILTLNSLRPGGGVGRQLVTDALAMAEHLRCRRVWLVTTNDNLGGQAFWKRVGFSLVQVHRGAMLLNRLIKPEIPRRGEGGVLITDELEFERILGAGPPEAKQP